MKSLQLHIDGVHVCRGFLESFVRALNKNLGLYMLSSVGIKKYKPRRFSVAQEIYCTSSLSLAVIRQNTEVFWEKNVTQLQAIISLQAEMLLDYQELPSSQAFQDQSPLQQQASVTPLPTHSSLSKIHMAVLDRLHRTMSRFPVPIQKTYRDKKTKYMFLVSLFMGNALDWASAF